MKIEMLGKIVKKFCQILPKLGELNAIFDKLFIRHHLYGSFVSTV